MLHHPLRFGRCCSSLGINRSRTEQHIFCDSHVRCSLSMRVRACVRASSNKIWKRIKPTHPLEFKITRGVQQLEQLQDQQEQQERAVQHQRASRRLVYVATHVVPLVHVRCPWEFEPTTSRRGTLYQQSKFVSREVEIRPMRQ